MDAGNQVTRELTDQDRARLAELDEAITKFEGQKRWSDVIKSILAKAEIVVEPSDKIGLLSQAGQMYLEKSSNQAEAIKCFEQVIELDQHNIEALTSLKEMYEKRRDWEKLVRAMEREAELLDPADRGLRYIEMAQLATERLRKPEICIDLWQKVLRYDGENADALGALAGLYERAREWQPLADVLEKQSAQVSGAEEQKALLTKLGMIYADKLNDDRGAVSAFQRLLAIDPDDRRAQEQLKRRYVALKAWDDLEGFYQATGKIDELIRTLEREAGNKDAPAAEQIDLMFRVARLWMQSEKADRAARAYEKVLDLDPTSHDAAVALAPLYEAAGDAKKLAGVIEVRLGHVQDPEERIVLLREVAVLYEEKLRRPQDAFARFLEAFALDPMREVLREDVARLAPGVDGWAQVIATYRTAIENGTDEDATIELRLSLGAVLEQVGQIDESIAQYRAVYDARSDHMGAIEALERLYRQTGRHSDLLEVYDRRMELEQDPDARRRMAYGRASLLETEIADADKAIDAYQSILAEWGDEEQDAYRALDALFEKQNRYGDLAATLERRIDLGPASDEELASLKFRLARVSELHLDDKAKALELLREVVTIVPEHDGGRLALEAMLSDTKLGGAAAQILEPIYEVRGDWTSLIRALEVLVGSAQEPERKLELLTKVGEVALVQLEDAKQAFGAYSRGLRAVPEHEETLERLEAIALEHTWFAELVKLVEELAGEAGDPALARRLWIRAARMHDAQLGAVDAAVAAYAKVLDQEPGDAEVLDALDELYRRTERYRDLVGVLRRKAELSGELAHQEQLLSQVADIHEQMLGEPASAISIYREILELDPTSRTALSSLDRLFEKQELWSDLADNIGRQLTIAEEPEEQTRLMLRLASLRETRMSAVEAAIEIYREVLERDATNAEALAALERLLATPAHQPVITEILEPLYRDANEFAKLIGIHEIQATIASASERRVELLHRIAELYEIALDDAPKAFESFARAIGEDASNATTQEQLERIAGMTGDYDALAAVYEHRVARFYEENESGRPSEEEVPLATHLLTKAAQIREDNLADVETAIAHHQRVLDLDATHLGAASSLERLFQQTERYEPLAHILLVKAAMLESPDEQKEHLFRAAAIHEDLLERPTDAIDVYKKVLDVDSEDLQALDKLVENYLKLEKWSELLDVYTRKADVVVDPDEKKRLYLEVGAVYERELSDGAKAIDTYQRILEIDPDDLMAIGRLDALYQAAGNWQELRSILEREAELASDPNEVISYRFRIADLYDHKLDDAARAVEGYQEILGVAPDHQPTLDALEAMIAARKMPVAAALVLEPIYQQFGEWAKLVAVLEVQAAHADDARQKVELLHRIAQLQEIQLESARAAFDAYARALPFDNGDPDTLGNLERLAGDLDAFGEVARLYDIEVEKLADQSDRRVELALRVAQLYEVQLGDVDSAIVRYNVVAAADETHQQAIEALDRLYEATSRWGELATTLAKEIQLAASPEAMLDLQFRLGQVHQLHLGQVDRAIEQYKEILAAAPEHAPALDALEGLFAEGVQPLVIGEILEPLYRMQEAWERLIGVQQALLEHQSDAHERVAMMHRVAEIAEDRAGEPQIAFEWHQRVLLEDPLNEQSTAETERLAGQLGNWEQLASTLADVLEQRATAEVRVPVGKRLARVYETEVGDIQRAVEAHLFVLGASPKEHESLEALDRIYSEHGASEALQEILAKRITATEDPRDLIELHFRRAQVLENDLGRIDEAVGVYTHVLDRLDAEHEGSIKSLANIYVEKQDWTSLYSTFDRELKVALGDTGRADVLAKMARVAEDHLGDDARAIQLWKDVLELRGEDHEALNALGELFAKGERWTELVDILDREAAIVLEDEQRVQIFGDLGRVWYAKLRNERNAVDNWQRVLDIDPTNTTALFALAEIHRAAGHTQDLVDTLHRVIDVGAATLDDGTLETVYMQLGELYERTLQQPMDAVDAYNKALDLNPRNFAAMDALEGIHSSESQWTDKVQVMERRVDGLDDAEQKITVLLAIAQTWAEKQEDADRGTSAYDRILGLDPRHEYAFAKLDELHRAAGRWENLVEMYITRTETAESTAERVDLLRRIAEVQDQRLDDKLQAFDTLLLAWEEDYTDKKTADDLEKVTAATRKWNDLLNTANTALTATTDPNVKIAICLRCAKWYSLELGHPEYAIPYYQQIQQLDPGNVPAQQQLADLYRSTQQWQLLAQTLGIIVGLTNDPRVKAETFVQMGELCETHLNIADQARSYYLQAVDADPSYVPGLEALEKVYRNGQEWESLLDIQQRKVGALSDAEALIEAKLAVAETYEDRLGNVEEAIETYRQVLEADGLNLRALKGLERLYAQRERWQDLLQILERQFEVVTTEKERITILLRVASMWEEEFVKPDKAAERLEKVVEIDSGNDAALRGLERLYRNMQRWDQLIDTYERHVSATPDRNEKQELYLAIGDVFSVELSDLDRAVDAYLNILSLNANNARALEALSKIYERRGDHGQAFDTMQQLSRLLNDPQQVVDLRFRMGKLLDEQLGDRSAAVDQYQSALDVEPGHLASLEAMRKIHLDSGDWLAAAKVLEQESQYQQQPRLVAKLLVELGRLYDERLDEHDRAINVWEAALKQDADNEDAALPLAEEYTKTQRWADAVPLLDALVKRSAKRDASEQHRLAFMLGEAALKTGDTDAAIKALSKASQLDQQHLPTLLALSSAYYQASNWDQAFKYYQMLLVHHRDALAKDEITDVFFKLGVVKREQGDRRKALNMFDKALEEDAQHRPTLEAVVGLYQSSSDWEQVIHFKKKILEQLDGEERFAMLDEIGDLWNEKLRNPQKAIESYADASEMRPKDHKILHKLLMLYQSTKQWDQAVEIIQRVSDLDDRASAKSKYAYTIAVILRDEVKDADKAIDYFNKSLDLDSTQLKAFEAINKILNAKKDWKQLERAYRKMLLRLKDSTDTDLKFNLAHALGVIYRDRMKQPEQAVDVFKIALAYQPDNAQEHQILAELYAVIPGRTDDAIAEHQWLLRQDPYRVDSYQALYKLYFDARQYDKAWCLASTLVFLKKADAEQNQFFEQYRQKGPIRPSSRLDNERWLKDLAHPEQDLVTSKIFEVIWPAVLSLKGKADKDAGLAPKYQVDPANSTVTLARTYGFVAQVLGMQAPRLFLRQDVPGGLVHLPVWPQGSLCGSTLLQGFQPQDLMFVCGRHLSDYRGEHFIRTMLPSNSELKTVLMAGLAIAGLVPANDPAIQTTVQTLAPKLNPAQIDALRSLGKRFLEAGARTDIKRWLQCVELTACRAGFLICNDLETAARMVTALGPAGPVDLPPKEKVKELVLFSVSEEYFRLRQALGIQLSVA
ncbi:tetratricopeptide repeat protein [Sandaracinus amylolyticus]|uniref:tetratricopeptide repeat protein n=1 Tax=Sandaracinus amylolyticus TaxID=927083 RepID=UPI00069FBE6C|nr:tetratricopeptide repeat protein [Sandaracinus amylolyticus]